MTSCRNMVIVLGDQLNGDATVLKKFDPKIDLLWMAEVEGEANYVWSHKARIALFFSAMRQFGLRMQRRGFPIEYWRYGEHDKRTLADALRASIRKHQPMNLVVTQPGDWRVLQELNDCTKEQGIEMTVAEDEHFIVALGEFRNWFEKRRQPRMEHFYRWQRKTHNVMMEDGHPVGGKWNFDRDNRKTFRSMGPALLRPPQAFRPDALTRKTLRQVQEAFAKHPGSLSEFDWPVNRAQARLALADFVEHRLRVFGAYQDAMWTDEPYIYHSRLSAALNLKLLNPREVINAVVLAYNDGQIPVAGAEGFIRQVLGWREYVRGLYWLRMPELARENALDARQPLPDFYWHGEVEMNCLRQVIAQTMRYGYAHHIQRLMVTGLYALLLGVRPEAVHAWYLAVYVDGVEWAELPNTLGMSQYADGGILASKPYAASGQYIKRMSNYCKGCRYDPDNATGDDACPFTTLYWDFVIRHRERFVNHPRAALQWKNLERLPNSKQKTIRSQAARIQANDGAPIS